MPFRLIRPEPSPLGPQETTDFDIAWSRNYFMVEVWSKDGMHRDRMLYGGNQPDKAWLIFEEFIKKRPRAYVTLRQRAYVMEKSRFARKMDDEQRAKDSTRKVHRD
jgi:hypothetical protein